jgi:tetraacyldisaccharide 4'-kinase
MIRPFALFVPLYAAVVGTKNAAFDRGWTKPQRLSWPVVSIGNLSVGGTGKTPLVIRLAQLLTEQNVTVDVLSRGYGRSSKQVERVDPDGDAARYGDEPLLIARAARVPVYVGASRYDAGLLAERNGPPIGIHLLDDGFQHRKLARNVDIVLLHAGDLTQALLPAGRLREPLSALRRASAIVLREEDRYLEQELGRRGIEAPVWIQHRRLTIACESPAIAFCGIARPQEFFSSLRLQNIDLAETLAFPDHHAWSANDLARMIALQQRHNAKCFVTTEKDAVRLHNAQRAQIELAAPLRIARLSVTLEDEVAIVQQLTSLPVRK